MDRPKILIVDDEEFMQKMYKQKFMLEGFEPLVAVDGEDALLKLQTFVPHVIVLDLLMPKLDGIETLKRIKANPQLNKVPVLILTNNSSGDKTEEALRLGAAAYLIKSNKTPNEVVDHIRKILNPSTPAS